MPRVSFTPNLQRHVQCPPVDVPGDTVRAVLDHAFDNHPSARHYVLDDQGAVRTHMVVFVNGRQITDRDTLTDPVPADAEVFVMQALSGG